MAVLKKIVVQNYRNIELAELEFSPNINCISGNNGEGKTNLIDAIYYLSMTKSSFSSSDRHNFRYGTDSFSLAGVYGMPGGQTVRFTLRVAAGEEKKLKKDDKPYPKISAHIGELPVVMVSPSDSTLVSESGEERRRFVNAVLSQMDGEYLAAIQKYNRLLAQRNKMLKDRRPDLELLDVIDAGMAQAAVSVYTSRKAFTKSLEPVVKEYYKLISGGKEEVSVAYRSDLDKGDLADLLARNREKDLILQYTSVGLQRDDLVFCMNGQPIRSCGSQGQQKSFLVALKFAQYELMKKSYGFPPMLLLDDVFDKLDMGRISNLLSMVAGQEFGQIFISDSNKIRLQSIVDKITEDRAYFETEAGNFTKTEV